MNLLGISAYYHDSAACLVRDGEIVAAAQEERFTRKKHDHEFPLLATRYCLSEGGVAGDALDAVVFYDKPLTKFFRILKTYFRTAPHGFASFRKAFPLWMRQKLWIPYEIERSLGQIGVRMPDTLLFTEHHESHAASAFFPSPFERAAILTMDGVGEWATTTVAHGAGNKIRIVSESRFPHSLGLLYSAFTYFTGFKVNSGEYKLMGLAPYGQGRYTQRILDNLLDLREDGSFRMDQRYFDYMGGLTMTNERFAALFDGPARKPETPITRREMDIAKSIQEVTEEVVLRVARHAHRELGETNLCLAGGVALNCVANGRLLREGPFENVWIQPAAGDAGGALGAALFAWHQLYGKARTVDGVHDSMKGSYLGPDFSNDEIAKYLEANGYPAERVSDEEWPKAVAKLIAEEKVVGLVNGRMEFGPRALGHRSIVGDPRSPKMQSVMNLKIKYRESFRPFAPSVLAERTSDYFELDAESPYMLLVAPVKKELCRAVDQNREKDIMEWVNEERSSIPAITHVDYSARVQSVSKDRSPRYHALIEAFEKITGCGVIMNTSFNVRGEPIVCTPQDAYRCFMRTEMDALVLENFILSKSAQPRFDDGTDWKNEFVLD
ncbi:MAG: carbamoyltransferase [Deltaproteobacteria bacterium]|nr:carbamoyltransferase [Deltaproteobacteria bacterium]